VKQIFKNKSFIIISSIVVILILAGGFFYFSKPVDPSVELTAAEVEEIEFEKKMVDLEPVAADALLIYKEKEGQTEFGDLYIKKNTGENEKLSSDILKDQFGILFRNNTSLFMDKDHNLFMKKEGKEKEKIATNVLEHSVISSLDETSILFLKSDNEITKSSDQSIGDLYQFEFAKEKEKLSSDVKLQNYIISDDSQTVAFINKDSGFYIKKKGIVEKEKISSDVNAFVMNYDATKILFNSNDKNMYVKVATDVEKVKISTENTGNVQITKNGKIFTFLDEYKEDKAKGELQIVKDGATKVKVSSDVTNYKLSDKGEFIYLKNEDNVLFVIHFAPEPVKKKKSKPTPTPSTTPIMDLKEKIASDVTQFEVSPDGKYVTYLDKDSNLFLKMYGKDPVKVAGDIKSVHISNEKILFIDSEKNLYTKKIETIPVDTKKADKAEATSTPNPLVYEKHLLSKNVMEYGFDPSLSSIAYFNDQFELSVKLKEAEPQKIITDLNLYNSVYFTNTLLFDKKVRMVDIVGIWQPDTQEEHYVEITKDGVMKNYYNAEATESKFKLEEATTKNGIIKLDGDSEYNQLPFEVVSKTQIKISAFEEGLILYNKITKAEFDKLIAAQKKKVAIQKALDDKISKANDTAASIRNTSVYVSQGTEAFYSSDRTSSAGRFNADNQLQVEDTFVNQEGEVWVKVYSSGYYWIPYNSLF
jgi:hypothetical protein